MLNKRKAQMTEWVNHYFERLFGNERPKPDIKWTKSTHILGASCQQYNYLKFSEPFIKANLDNERCLEVLVIHEVCHLAVPKHNADFKRLCRQFGNDVPSGTGFEFPGYHAPAANYYARCSKCGQEYTRMRAPSPSHVRCCIRCDTVLEYTKTGSIK